MHIIITSPKAEDIHTTLSEFIADNIDSLDVSGADAIADAIRSGQSMTIGGGAAPEASIKVDWYQHSDDLKSGDVFTDYAGDLVMLDRRVPGDGTKWYVADWSAGSWGYYDSTVEPGDLVARAVEFRNQEDAA